MQSVPITTKVLRSNPACSWRDVLDTTLYEKKFHLNELTDDEICAELAISLHISKTNIMTWKL